MQKPRKMRKRVGGTARVVDDDRNSGSYSPANFIEDISTACVAALGGWLAVLCLLWKVMSLCWMVDAGT